MAAGALAGGCSPDQRVPIEKDRVPPGEIRNISVEALPGGAKITYTLPSDPDLLYVLAEYTGKSGRSFEFKSSYYSNFLVVNGFSDVSQYNINMYAVDRSGNRSRPVIASVTPATPPVISAFNSLTVKADFGGVRATFENPSKSELAIVVSTPDSEGKMAIASTYYTAMGKGVFVLRGYDPKPRKFEVYVKDRWGNKSEVLRVELTPVNEVKLDKSKFKEMSLPGDSPANAYGGAIRYIWDEKVVGGSENLHTGNTPSPDPKMFTFDLGVETKLSRFIINGHPDDIYSGGSMKRYEIWGTANLDKSGSLDSWTKLIEYTGVKPSGLPLGQLTNEDNATSKKGDEGTFSPDLPKVRYIRIRCLENWSGTTNIVISEVTFWGTE